MTVVAETGGRNNRNLLLNGATEQRAAVGRREVWHTTDRRASYADGRMGRRTDGQTDGRTDERKDGRTDGQ